MLGAYIRNAPPRVHTTTVSEPVFQTGYVGSIPTGRFLYKFKDSSATLYPMQPFLCIVAQLVERSSKRREVAGSSPVIKGILTFGSVE